MSSEKIEYKCEFCSKEFTTRTNLNTHQKTAKYCLEKQGIVLNNFICEYCNKPFSKQRLNEHVLLCKKKKDKYTEDIMKQFEECKLKLLERDAQIAEKERQIRELREMLDMANNTIAEIAKQPKINNNNTTNIKGNQTIKNILSDYKTYDEQTDYERILSIAKDADMEKYFWRGQKGLAQFCVEHIAKTQDGKMIICCTDPSRGRFKHVNDKNELCEDIDARSFTSKISEPIKEVVEEVHNNIQKGIDDKLTDEECDPNFLSSKKNLALEKYIQIKNIDNNLYNKEYKKELCALLNI
jgi:hypothetical protein